MMPILVDGKSRLPWKQPRPALCSAEGSKPYIKSFNEIIRKYLNVNSLLFYHSLDTRAPAYYPPLKSTKGLYGEERGLSSTFLLKRCQATLLKNSRSAQSQHFRSSSAAKSQPLVTQEPEEARQSPEEAQDLSAMTW